MTSTKSGRPVRYLTRSEQAARYGRDIRTIKRWGKNKALGMPEEYIFNDPNNPMRREDQLEIWERSRVAPREDAA
jgi:hypothetical protein